LNLNWYHYGFRVYDPAIGRFPSLDPISDRFPHVSPYNYAENEPVGSIDLWGLQRWMVNGRERTSPPTSFIQNGTTVATSMVHPVAASRVGSAERGGVIISSVSGRIARHVAGNGNMSVGIGTERNAFRHALWSSAITSEFGAETAQDLTNAHEGVGIAATSAIDFTRAFEGNLDLADNIVDLLNNEIGREIGLNNEGANMLELADQVLEVFSSEGLWVAQENKDGSITITRSKISAEQANNARNAANALDQNGMSEEDRQELENENR
jgi:hypothetical protein